MSEFFHAYPALSIQGRARNVERGEYVRRHINVDNHTVLDIACNEGYYSHLFAEMGAQSVHGIDRDASSIMTAKLRSQQLDIGNVSFEQGDLWGITGRYDTVFASEILLHVEQKVKFIKLIQSLAVAQVVIMSRSVSGALPLVCYVEAEWGWDSVPSLGWFNRVVPSLGLRSRLSIPDKNLFSYDC